MESAAIYVHFPFCERKCPYCDFASFGVGRCRVPHDSYAAAIEMELTDRLEFLRRPFPVSSLYIGGGTPSLWTADSVKAIFKACEGLTGLRLGEDEITVECNPLSLSRDWLASLVDSGLTRVSIGVQSTEDRWLGVLGRLHTAEDGFRAVETAMEVGVRSISVDMMYGLPGQTVRDAEAQARRLASLGVDHISAYVLSIQANTVFGRELEAGRLVLPDEQQAAEAYLSVSQALQEAGFRQYEVSNYARAGSECRHHLMVWRGAEYLGLGSGAVGTVTGGGGEVIRWRNRASVRWTDMVARPKRSWWSRGYLVEQVEHLSREELLMERVMLGLRLAEGVDLDLLEQEFGPGWWTPRRQRVVKDLLNRGRLEMEGRRLRIPTAQFLWENDTISRLV